MPQDNVIDIKKPESVINDPITTVLRNGARRLLAQALEAEIEVFINQYTDLKDELGRRRIVRNGFMPERKIQSGIGSVPVKAPRVWDRHSAPLKRIRFSSTIQVQKSNILQAKI